MREFSDSEDLEFSSFAQLIGLARCLETVYANGRNFEPEPAAALATSFDASVMGWLSLLPLRKRELLRKGDVLDEQLFRANLILNV